MEFQNVRTDIVATWSHGRIEGVDCIKHLLGQTQPYCGIGKFLYRWEYKINSREHRFEVLADNSG